MKTFAIESDGSLVVTEDAGKNPDGTQAVRRWWVRRDQVAAHRCDADFDAALPAAIKAVLDAPPATK